MNMSIGWAPELETGIEIIDQQHRQLVECLCNLSEAIDAGDIEQVRLHLHRLTDSACAHNHDENQLLYEAGYPDIDIHQRQHQAFRVRAHAWSLQLGRDDHPLQRARQIRTELALWLANHIEDEDRQYLPWVQRYLHPSLLQRLYGQLFARSSHTALPQSSRH